MELKIDFEKQNDAETKSKIERILNGLERKSERDVNILSEIFELIEAYKEGK